MLRITVEKKAITQNLTGSREQGHGPWSQGVTAEGRGDGFPSTHKLWPKLTAIPKLTTAPHHVSCSRGAQGICPKPKIKAVTQTVADCFHCWKKENKQFT